MKARIVTLLGLLLLGAGCVGSGLTVEATAPLQVQAGDDVDIVVSVTNESAEMHEVTSVTVSGPLYEGLFAYGTQPLYQDWYINADQAYVAVMEDIVVSPGETEWITIPSNAVWTGDYLGQVIVCFDGVDVCEESTLGIQITQANE